MSTIPSQGHYALQLYNLQLGPLQRGLVVVWCSAQQTVPLKQMQHDAQFTYALVQYQIITVFRVLNQFLVQHLDANLKIFYRVFGINSHGFQDAF